MDDQPIESMEEERSGGLGARAFMGLAALVLVIGLSISGAFVIGIQVGQSQQEEVEEVPQLALTADDSLEEEGDDAAPVVTFGGPGESGGEIPPEALRQIQAQMRAQGASEEEIAAISVELQQSRAGQGQGFRQGRPGFLVGTGGADDTDIGTRMAGTIESIDGNTITLMTSTGLQRISTIAGTRITVTQLGDLADLAAGDRVTVAVVPGPEQDLLEAASITAVSGDE
ncbi:MAG: hypothetical protein OXC55_04875 [Chloroflexi bacterium]|nr:hypothetical protein [Chloroflexota bacterium]